MRNALGAASAGAARGKGNSSSTAATVEAAATGTVRNAAAGAGHATVDEHPMVFLGRWVTDTWLEGYQQRTAFFMQTDDEGQVIATFVRKDPETLSVGSGWRRWKRAHLWRKPAAILYVHGWNDHFYRIHASEFWESLGVRFYAIDLAKFGRSYRNGQTPGYTENLHSYFPQLDALRDTIVDECGPDVRILVIGHSMGGLIASLWLDHTHPRNVTALALNSPWLELQLTRFGRLLTTPVVRGFTAVGGKNTMPLNDPGFYGRTLYRSQDGEWDYERYQNDVQYVPRAGWLYAIYRAQDEIAHGLDIPVPVLVCTSDKSMLQTKWDPAMAHADTVLDVQSVRAAAVNLGKLVTIATIPDALHDISLSCPTARVRYFKDVAMWASQWAWDDSPLPRRWLNPALDVIRRASEIYADHGDGSDGNGATQGGTRQTSAASGAAIAADGAKGKASDNGAPDKPDDTSRVTAAGDGKPDHSDSTVK